MQLLKVQEDSVPMVHCRKCGRENVADAKFCDKCGTPMMIGQKAEQAQAAGAAAPTPPAAPSAPSAAPPSAPFGESVGREMSAVGERFGREMGRVGERVGKEFEDAGRRWERKYGRKTSVFGPLVGAVVCWGILVFIILGIQSARISPGNEPSFPNLGTYLAGNLLIFLGFLLLFGYVDYGQKKMRAKAKWVLPVTVAACLTIISWFAAEAFAALAVDQNSQTMADSAQFGKTFIPVIFIVIVVVGYLIVLFGTSRSAESTILPPRQY